ncbi:hypothetical protein PhCBS80983_g04968 [Powellomyces hirtus]|uniref:Iron-binding zinc finger CDGSH type domain-containing protein n=1 Tax=Powellomyces hirtus TaxID=109895 RepID=A0A507DVU0_9FUNG|nr:hypothetical protein DFJ77DRAFT_48643 [Powellomyces hirtus]TPX55864.1 hypothetical protein PhCBS80983_g04968 [Powellomyces hirtus]
MANETPTKTGALTQGKPYAVELAPGKPYFFCTCGESSNQPFCDGTHKGSGFTPKKFTVEEAKTYYLCGCRESANLPFCDGTHRKEAGIRKYNEFLLKRNTELTTKLALLDKKVKLTTAVAAAAAGVAIVLGAVRLYGR